MHGQARGVHEVLGHVSVALLQYLLHAIEHVSRGGDPTVASQALFTSLGVGLARLDLHPKTWAFYSNRFYTIRSRLDPG